MTAVLQTSNVGTHVSARSKHTPQMGGNSGGFSSYGVTASDKDNWRARHNAKKKRVIVNGKEM